LWALTVRPRGRVWADVERTETDSAERAVTRLAAPLHLAAPPGTAAARLRVGRPGHGVTEALVDVPRTRDLPLTASSVRTGAQPLFEVAHQGLGPGGHLTGPRGTDQAAQVLVLPRGRAM